MINIRLWTSSVGRHAISRICPLFCATVVGLVAGYLVAEDAGGGTGPLFVVAGLYFGVLVGARITCRSGVFVDAFYGAVVAGIVWTSIVVMIMSNDGPGGFILWNVPAAFLLGSLAGGFIAGFVAITGRVFDWIVRRSLSGPRSSIGTTVPRGTFHAQSAYADR
jgi:uncharacterized membrane protein AbrB (regulator of aidB expression)